MQAPRDVIRLRIGSVENTAGSVTAVATWCGAHAFQSADVLAEWVAVLTEASTSTDQRVGLVHVLHEVVLSCLRRGAGDPFAQQMMHAVAQQAPAALRDACRLEKTRHGNDAQLFATKLSVVLGAWQTARAFPRAWLTELVAATAPSAAGRSDGRSDNVPEELQQAVRLLAKFKAAKERQARVAGSDSATQDAVEAATQESVRRLVPVVKALEEATQKLNAELATLRGDDGDDTAAADPLAAFFDE